MTTHHNSLSEFVLAAGQGRTSEPLDMLGEEVLVKLANAGTQGAAAIFHLTASNRRTSKNQWVTCGTAI